MSNYLKIAIAMTTFLVISCDPGPSAMKDLPVEEWFPLSIQKGSEFDDPDLLRAQALSIIDYRIQNSEKALSMMTYGYWWPEFVFNKDKITQEGHYDGYWIKYEDDYSYTYGKYDVTWGGGKYHYDLDKKELRLLDNDSEQEPKVFQGNYNGEIMSYIGMHEFGVNNGLQIKMVPLDNKPVAEG